MTLYSNMVLLIIHSYMYVETIMITVLLLVVTETKSEEMGYKNDFST